MTVPAVIPKSLFAGQATAAGATIYTTPATTTAARLTALIVTNIDASPHTFSVYTSLGAMTMNDAHAQYKNVPIAAGATVAIIVPLALGFPTSSPQTGSIAIQADADSVLDVTLFGSEIDSTSPTVGRALPHQYFQGVLTATPGIALLYGNATANFSGIVMSLTFCNVDGSPHDVDIQVSFDGGSSYFKLRKGLTIPANDSLVVTDQFIIGPTGGTGLEILTAIDPGNTGFITCTASIVQVSVAP
jgi:hypothetical protein